MAAQIENHLRCVRKALDRLRRSANPTVTNGIPTSNLESSVEGVKANLPALSPEEDEAALYEAGFENTQLFYAGFTHKGWVAYGPE